MGTHGSITKAGKVRQLTPKVDPKPRKPTRPIASFRSKYKRRIINKMPRGQRRRIR